MIDWLIDWLIDCLRMESYEEARIKTDQKYRDLEIEIDMARKELYRVSCRLWKSGKQKIAVLWRGDYACKKPVSLGAGLAEARPSESTHTILHWQESLLLSSRFLILTTFNIFAASYIEKHIFHSGQRSSRSGERNEARCGHGFLFIFWRGF